MSRRVAAIGLAVLFVGLLVVPIAVATGDAGTEPPASSSHPATESVNRIGDRQPADSEGVLQVVGSADFDRTLFSIEVFENASARWTFQYTRVFNDSDIEADRESFKAFAAEFRENETELYRQFLASAEDLARSGSNVTGRSMNATGFSRDARTGTLGNTGIVEMSFTWTAFGQQREGDGVFVSDVFEGGIYVRSDQRLEFVPGPNLAFESADPTPTETSDATLAGSEWLAWQGERSFSDRRPRVAFQPASAVPTETTIDGGSTEPGTDGTTTASEQEVTTAGDGTESTTAAGATSPGIGMLVTLAALVLIALGIGAAAWVNGYFDSLGGVGSRTDDGSSGDEPGDAPPTTEAAGGAEGVLLSDEDRVTQLLEDNGGRMKQTEIVDATEWSKSKVSMLLSEMEEDGAVTKLRVGRENIVSLPGAEPDAAGSPFDDEDED